MMRKRLIIYIFLLASVFAYSQKVRFETLLKDDISIRAIEINDGKIYYAGTHSKFGYVNPNDSTDKKQIRLSHQNLQFRTLAKDQNYFYTINIESPAYFFQINAIDLTHRIIFKDTLKTAFYDALHFVNTHEAYAFSDPDKDLNLKLMKLKPEKKTFIFPAFYSGKKRVKMNEDEAAFAASNTNIASYKNTVWLGTGGGSARILKFSLKSDEVELFETNMIQDSESQGIYSIDFYDDTFGIAVGGDYTRQDENINNIATTNNGGKSWIIRASGKNAGYMTCVKIRPDSKGKDIVAIGDQHISYSSDYGNTWTKISDEKNLYTCQWLNKNTLVLAGKNRIVKMILNF